MTKCATCGYEIYSGDSWRTENGKSYHAWCKSKEETSENIGKEK